MSNKQRGIHGVWRGRWVTVLAVAGSAVGLGNIWKFPYITGENGGGAFVLMYLGCILIAGLPLMLAELLIGRHGRLSPVNTMINLVKEQKSPRVFSAVGGMGVFTSFCILSFYSVIAGWTVAYVFKMASGSLIGADATVVNESFSVLLASPWMMLFWHTIFMVMTGVIIALGVNKGLENSARIMMPALFLMLIGLLGYSLTTPGFMQGFEFLFSFDASKLNDKSLMIALGHSFFTLSVGMGTVMAYGAYMPSKAPLTKTVLSIGIIDTAVALVAGLIIFPLVFSHGLTPSEGPGLLFQTLPLAFSQIPAGALLGTVFFVLVVLAAWTSSISITEPAVAWLVEKGFTRVKATLTVCGLAWLIGIGAVLSFNVWSDYKLFDRTFFGNLDFLSSNIMMPLGGLLIAIFIGWVLPKQLVEKEAGMHPRAFALWRFIVRFISPLVILFIFLNGLS